ncbi:MAG: alpha/beta hydrolase [Nitrospinae bacterium]|nr:alpha/beta hydrolase [Nitrospinota bacterium]
MTSIFDSQAFNANLFFPRTDSSPPPGNTDEYYIDAPDGVRIHARCHPNSAANLSLLFFHGNGEIVSDYDDLARLFSGLGVELIIADFRGYGKSTGTPTLRTALEDSHLIFDYLKGNSILKPKVCVMGRSLGSAPTIELCSKRTDIQGMVLESGYADPIPLVERRGLKIDKTTAEENALFNNSQKISEVKCPTLIMHGEDDYLISPKEAQLNYENAGSKIKTLEILEGVGHNDMMMAPEHSYFTTLKRFFDSL